MEKYAIIRFNSSGKKLYVKSGLGDYTENLWEAHLFNDYREALAEVEDTLGEKVIPITVIEKLS